MIRFDKVCKSYGQRELFNDLSFCINPHDKCGFVGRNGSGKTTLFRLLTNKEAIESGRIVVPKDFTFSCLEQHLSFSQKTILEEAIHNMTCEEWEKEYRAETVLFGLGFKKEDMNKDPRELSGGYQLRVHLAKVLFSDASCLLLDEPTNYLDIVSIRWLKKFLKSWNGSFIIISHDREFLDSVSNHTIGLHRTKIYKIKGGTNNLFKLILQEEEHYEASRLNIEKKREHMESFVKRFGAKASKASQAKSKQKALDKIQALEQLTRLHSLKFNFNEKPFSGKKILTSENISFSYNMEDDSDLIKNLSLTIEKGEKIAIVGKNGYGKSTILKLLSKELKSNSGSLSISENASIGYFGQTNIDRLDPSSTILEEIISVNPALNIGEVRRICGIMMFKKSDVDKKVSILSGGEKSRVLLGKILATKCNLLLLDEPTNHLDMESIESLLEALEDFAGAVVLVTHSEMILNRLFLDKLIICHQKNQNLFLGNYSEFLEKKGWSEDEENKKDKKKLKCLKPKKNNDALKELKKEIKKLENKIISLEKAQKKDSDILSDAYKNGQSEQIAKFSKIVSDRQEEIESLFVDLEMLSKQYEKKEKKNNL
jgi:ATP-binding cassette, subfamily F, member 3